MTALQDESRVPPMYIPEYPTSALETALPINKPSHPFPNYTHCRDCPLRAKECFHKADVETLDFIDSFKDSEKALPAGGRVLREGERSSSLFTLLDGWAFRFRGLSDGRRQILNFLLPGDFIGLQEQIGEASPFGVEMITPGRVCVFPQARLWTLFKTQPALGYDITWLGANAELIVDENLVSVGQRRAMARIGMLLIHLFRRAEALGLTEGPLLRLPLNQQHMADAMGLSLVHTNKSLRRLRDLDLVDWQPGMLRLGNIAQLQQLADYDALTPRHRPLI